MDIDELPEWPADKPLPDDAVVIFGAQTVEEAVDFLRRRDEADEHHRQEVAERTRLQQERSAEEAQRVRETVEGLRRFGRGEVQLAPAPPAPPAVEEATELPAAEEATELPPLEMSPVRLAAIEGCRRRDSGEQYSRILEAMCKKYELGFSNRETLATYLKPSKRPEWLKAALAGPVTTSP